MNWQDLLQQADDGGSYEAIPEGPYQAVVSDATAKNAASGKPMIVAVFEVTAGPYKGRRVWNNFVLSRDNANALSWFFKHMNALGLSKDFFAHNPSLETVAAQLKGKTCTIDVTQKVWNNETRNDVKKITPASGASSAPTGFAPSSTPASAPEPASAEASTPAPNGQPPAVPF
jgi:hypothetical protein